MLQGKKAYICSPLSAPNPEGMQHNMELAKYYLMQMKRLYHCRTFASHAHLPLMLDDRIPEERETAMQIGALMLDLCEVLIIQRIAFIKNRQYTVAFRDSRYITCNQIFSCPPPPVPHMEVTR